MAKHIHLPSREPRNLAPMPRKPLARTIAVWIATATCTGVTLMGRTAAAQASNMPSPTNPAVQLTATGTQGVDGTGAAGETIGGWHYIVQPGLFYGDNSDLPSMWLSTIGGIGGVGVTGNPSGTGGQGGGAGTVQLDIDAGAGISSGSTAPAAVWLVSKGGAGGGPGLLSVDQGTPGVPGAGGSGNAITVNQYGNVWSTNGWHGSTPGTTAVALLSAGGDAGEPTDVVDGAFDTTGTVGGVGGAGGQLTYNFDEGGVYSAGSGIVAISQGGHGGDGTNATSDLLEGTGGTGGAGGNGGAIAMTVGLGGAASSTIVAAGAPSAATGAQIPVDANGNVAQAAVMAAGIQAQSLGGVGGMGGTGDGTAGKAGAGGAAGDAGTVNLALNDVNITTSGFAAAGVLAQSIGGAGGNGNSAGGILFKHGGNGAAGGTGAAVGITMGNNANEIWPSDLISTGGDDSIGVIAQSIGGGGGAGGAVQGGSDLAGVAIGGDGESGGNSGTVSLANGTLAQRNAPAEAGFVISTQGEHSSGLVAQSIGGGGGTGGSATNSQIGAFNYVVGGSGGSGGAAGTAGTLQTSLTNLGIVSTAGDHAKGMVAQAVGGGGGDGGSAAAFSLSSMFNINTAVGGNGGKGGTAGDVQAINDGQVLTSGADGWGSLAQSISGGGGNGGSSLADAFLVPSAPGVPTVEINTSVGGNGGDSSGSGNVTSRNGAVIMTAGPGAHGLIAQSIAGGGGNGGDSSTLAAGVYVGKGMNFNLETTVGGNGGQGGVAGNVNVDNSAGALIWTLGDSADGIVAQSISGGGGTAGTAKNTSEFVGGGEKGSASFTVGGAGGTGGTAGTVSVTNEGNILTIGDSARGVVAQSIGGGGGMSSGGTVKGSVGKQSEQMKIAGGNGVAGDGGTVNVTNSATILTYGGNAAGMVAQSIGGGGGAGGTGAVSGLETSGVSLSDYLAQSKTLNGSGTLKTSAGVIGFDAGGWIPSSLTVMQGWAQDYLTYATAHPDPTPDALGGIVDMQVFVGGGTYGGEPDGSSAQGDGGQVTGTNNFSIITNGPASAGMILQSIGAGGGTGGASVSSQFENKAGYDATTEITVGGKAANLGDGGTVTANNSGTITTGCNAASGCNPALANNAPGTGDASFGILAQSIGGGGGESVVTAGNFAQPGGTPIQINLAGSLETQGDGGAVVVNNNSGGNITTTGNDSVGIVAQSVGGGGGNVVVMQAGKGSYNLATSTTDPTLDAAGNLNSVSVGTGALPDITVFCPDKHVRDSCGNGGAVTVTAAAGSTVSTNGRNAHGVLAQSIGGGGGWIAGLAEKAANPFNKPDMSGDAGDIAMNLGGTIVTGKDGSYGVLAQSVGGGGVLGGDLATTNSYQPFPGDGPNVHDFRVGNGGSITIGNTGTISTTGNYATALFAQSVGGGGGLYATTSGLWMGTSGGTGNAGTIDITNSGTIQATGTGSSAVVVDTQGLSNTSQVTVSNSGAITGNSTATAIDLVGNNGNGDGTVTNTGSITANNGLAIQAQSFAVVNNNAGGVINGDVSIGNSGTLNNTGTWNTNDTTTAGTVNNTGLLVVGGANTTATSQTSETTISGSLNSPGTIQMNVDFFNQLGNFLYVTGNLAFSNSSVLAIKPSTLAPNDVVEIIAGGYTSAALPRVTDPGNNYLFTYNTAVDYEGVLTVQANPGSQFAATAVEAGAYGNQLAVANNLDTTWHNVNGLSLSQAQNFASLATVGNGQAYLAALTSLGNEGGQAASVAHVVAGNAFFERMNSCPRFEDGAQDTREHDCVWGRVIGSNGNHDATGNSVGYRQDGNVVQLGGQREVASDWFVGASVSADSSHLDTRAVSDSINGHGWTAGAVVKHQDGDWLVSAALEGGSMSYEARREAQLPGLGGTARSDFDVSHWGLHSRISRQFGFDEWYLKPYIDLHATHIIADGYTERGAGPLDLKVSSSSSNVFSTSPMLEAGSNFKFNNGMSLQLYGGIGGAFYNQGSLGGDMQFADAAPGSGTFHISSDLPNDRLRTNVGLDLRANQHWDMRLDYTGEFASHFSSNTGALKVSYAF